MDTSQKLLNLYIYYLPALLDTTVRADTFFILRALIRFSGIPQSPKPPTNNFEPSDTS